MGTEFWLTFTENLYAPKDSVLHIMVAPTLKDTITIYNPQLNLTERFEVNPGQQNNISVLNKSSWYSTLSFGATGSGVRITSKNPIQVYAVNLVDGSMDITALLPKTVLQNARQYEINNVGGDPGKQSQIAIVAMDTGTTEVEITAGSDLTGLGGKGTVINRKLKWGQVFSIQALSNQDLAGTTIKVVNSCKRIAVFTGSKCSVYPNNGTCASCDALFEQAWPTSLAQLEFFVPPVPGNSKFTIKALAIANSTNITVNGVFEATINSGETFEKVYTGPALVNSNQPIHLLQVLHSSGCNGAIPAVNGDPSIVAVAGTTQKVNRAVFQVFRAAQFQHKMVAWFEQNAQPTAWLNGVPIQNTDFVSFITGGRKFWIASTTVTANKTWTLFSDSAFVLYQYGMAPNISYANISGVSFERTDADFSVNPSLVCNPNSTVTFKTTGDSLGNITWYFGDGNTSQNNPGFHVYGKSGTYKATMFNDRSSSCPDSISRIVTVLDGPTALLPQDTNLCTGNSLRIELPTQLKYAYFWDNGSTSFVQTFASSRTAVLTITDTNNCFLKDTLTVTVNDCDDYELKLANVFTPGNDGFNDQWVIYYKGYTQIKVSIYNRWGVNIYEYTLPDNEHWNGMVDNQFIDCPAGVYFYRIQAIARTSEKNKTVSGSIQLIR